MSAPSKIDNQGQTDTAYGSTCSVTMKTVLTDEACWIQFNFSLPAGSDTTLVKVSHPNTKIGSHASLSISHRPPTELMVGIDPFVRPERELQISTNSEAHSMTIVHTLPSMKLLSTLPPICEGGGRAEITLKGELIRFHLARVHPGSAVFSEVHLTGLSEDKDEDEEGVMRASATGVELRYHWNPYDGHWSPADGVALRGEQAFASVQAGVYGEFRVSKGVMTEMLTSICRGIYA